MWLLLLQSERMNKTRAMLDKQMEEVNANRLAEAQKRLRDKEESDRWATKSSICCDATTRGAWQMRRRRR